MDSNRYLTPPTIQLRNLIRDIILKLEGEYKQSSISSEIKNHFLILEQFADNLSVSIESEEHERPEYTINYSDFILQQELLKKLELTQKNDEEMLLKHKMKLAQIDDEVRLIHQKIIETQQKAVVNDLKKIAADNRLHLEIDEELEEIQTKIEAESCCIRNFSFFQPANIKESFRKTNSLAALRMKLNSTNPVEISEAIITHLSKKRMALEKKKEILEKEPPNKTDDALRLTLAKVTASIEIGENQYYFAISNETMFHLIRFFIIYHKLTQAFIKLDLTIFSQTTPIEKNILLSDIFLINIDKIKEFIAQFWCPHSNNHNGTYFFNFFFNLPLEKQNALISTNSIQSELIECLVPFQEIRSIQLPYHPIGTSKQLPKNCPKLKL